MKPRQIRTISIAIIALISTFLIGKWAISSYQAAQRTATSSKIQIVASTNVWGDIAVQIGGNNVEVTSIMNDPATDPHLFESDAKTASMIAKAQLVIVNGLGYDEFMNKLLDVAPDQSRTILTVSDILKANKDANPHLWYDLPRVKEVAVAIQNELTKIDPLHAAEYTANTRQFIAELQPAITKLTPHSAGVAYTERVAGYLIEDLGLTNKTPLGFSESVENGTEPSPQQVAEFQKVLKSGQVKMLVYNNQTTNDVTEQIKKTALDAGVTVVGVSETLPKGKNFQTWQLQQLNAILEAL